MAEKDSTGFVRITFESPDQIFKNLSDTETPVCLKKQVFGRGKTLI